MAVIQNNTDRRPTSAEEGKDYTPFGYRIENGVAVIDEDTAGKLRMLYANYLNGMSLKNAANDAGIETFHDSAKRLLMTEHYLGDDFYPAIIDKETFDRVQTERIKRAAALGRLDRKSTRKTPKIPTQFSIGAIMEHYDNPATQAEYVYGLLKGEVV